MTVIESPEDHGLIEVLTLNLCEDMYAFDLVVVFMDVKTKKFYTAADTGCSCPIPFEQFKTREHLNGPLDWHQVVKLLSKEASRDWRGDSAEKNLVSAIEKLMKYR